MRLWQHLFFSLAFTFFLFIILALGWGVLSIITSEGAP